MNKTEIEAEIRSAMPVTVESITWRNSMAIIRLDIKRMHEAALQMPILPCGPLDIEPDEMRSRVRHAAWVAKGLIDSANG
jgi:hypothetical protein